jgi:hypothetical protein
MNRKIHDRLVGPLTHKYKPLPSECMPAVRAFRTNAAVNLSAGMIIHQGWVSRKISYKLVRAVGGWDGTLVDRHAQYHVDNEIQVMPAAPRLFVRRGKRLHTVGR